MKADCLSTKFSKEIDLEDSSSSDSEMDSSPELRDIKTRLKSSVIISPKDGGKIYKCFFCPKIFKEMINAQRHILSRKKCLLKNEEKNVSKDDLETVIKSTPTENKMKEMKLELKRLDNNSASKNKTENCGKCAEKKNNCGFPNSTSQKKYLPVISAPCCSNPESHSRTQVSIGTPSLWAVKKAFM